MIDTIMFDLDGTLLRYSQDDFLASYFAELRKVFTGLGLDAELAIKATWAGTKAMVLGDGSRFNTFSFWEAFADFMSLTPEQTTLAEAACDNFYRNEFNAVKRVMAPGNLPGNIIRSMAAKGYTLVLATNPLFPACAITSRLAWIGLEPADFIYISHYSNSTYCKPNLEYYREIFTKINKAPELCLMIGNNPAEDMCAGELGSETFLVTDYLENQAGLDITLYRRGSLTDLETYLNSLPPL